ncbi:lipopolysaccharide heptosyltransferase II [Sporomusa acidovorans]|uniref:lipopolysaccharide heptosyltransferase II n=1 Tax=Sporomusa acidovorans (strain ATCC 49682 / DSM 3132 / Mol) TaxID=1123286 RepID=A0ABZ3J7S3_SPOA4|nr:lipopolysaccharide heptosyltransferase II [Sporomusa acidovorans]OZC19329.1 lipopolysaccharide core heptosyltransferase RfaQ [Sporomusa acidovorans DSM 3132]SDD80583.1 heptosyltransferase-1 [Sporomusa acidovorans]
MSYSNILIVKLSAIGDVIHALPVATALKQQFPAAKITWVVEKPAYDLLTNNPYIDELVIFDKAKYKSLGGLLKHGRALARQLKAKKFDLALDLQGLFKSAAIIYLSGATTRLGYCNMRELSHLVSRPVFGPNQTGHVVDRYLDVVRALGCEVNQPVRFPIQITAEEAMSAEAVATHAGLRQGNRYVVLAPGTNWPTKCWPVSHFAELANMLWQDQIIPVLIGGRGDQRLSEDISQSASIPPVDLTGKTGLKQLAHVIKQAVCFIGGDTGPMHLAVAVNTPVIALFGPTDPLRNGPYGAGAGHQVLLTDRACRDCWKRECPRHEICLDVITPGQVYQTVGAVLTKCSATPPKNSTIKSKK